MSKKQRAHFRLMQVPCCNSLLCWVNPRLPNLLPECETGPGPSSFWYLGTTFRYSVMTIALASAASNSSYNAIAAGLLRKRLA